jgi:hypothetical protein
MPRSNFATRTRRFILMWRSLDDYVVGRRQHMQDPCNARGTKAIKAESTSNDTAKMLCGRLNHNPW